MLDPTPYEIVAAVRGTPGKPVVFVGSKGACRFCGEVERKKFRKVSHTFPEALGSKWVRSLDECDSCNNLFSVYEDALAKAVGPILTIGGTLGKDNKVRQTGRSAGKTVIKHSHPPGGIRNLSFSNKLEETEPFGYMNLTTGCLEMVMPLPPATFVPNLAYRSLVKMAIGILPVDRLVHFQKLIDWLRNPSHAGPFDHLKVGISFGSIGNAPPFAVGILAQRTNDKHGLPYMLFFFSAGSLCFQIDLKPDSVDGPWPPQCPCDLNVKWTNIITDDDGNDGMRIEYGMPTQFDWAPFKAQPQPFEKLTLQFNPRTLQGALIPKLRP